MDNNKEFKEICKLLLLANPRHLRLVLIYLKKLLKVD